MSYTPRHTATIAREDLYGTGGANPGYLNRLLTLTSGDPTTSELEEAVQISRLVTARLLVWVSARHLSDKHKTMTGPKAEEIARIINPSRGPLVPAVTQYTEVDFCDLTIPELEASLDEVEAQATKDAEARQQAEAERIQRSHPEVFAIHEALAMVRPPHLAREA